MRPWCLVVPAALYLILGSTGCAFFGHHSSPWEFGGGVRVAPGFPVGHGGTTVHPVVSVGYMKWDGGHDELYEVGGQVRQRLTRPGSGSLGLWLGGEATFSVLREVGSGWSASTNGWSLSALAGVPVGASKWGLNVYGAAGISHYGSGGVNVRFGVDLQPWFLRR
jgi:hypothetical protein